MLAMFDKNASPTPMRAASGGLLVKPVLASGSPQRTAILDQLGIPHVVDVANIRERMDGDPRELAEANALLKAHDVAKRHPFVPVIGSDTIVVLEDGTILGKPADLDEARTMLARLTGATHTVISGLAIVGPGRVSARSGIAETTVSMRTLAADAIDRHLAHGEWEGRAGAYAIQGRGAGLVTEIQGDYLNVVGLPVALLATLVPELLDRGPRKGTSATETGAG
ncbi:MAG: nucleoside triphosphate pyrophosphatase [Solirubrobacteraceae bacterium]|nr:nucleoside triphosphate pyrophosphatase [Solirubrobacteraceae bacterium]